MTTAEVSVRCISDTCLSVRDIFQHVSAYIIHSTFSEGEIAFVLAPKCGMLAEDYFFEG
jgi:hypothetical protein